MSRREQAEPPDLATGWRCPVACVRVRGRQPQRPVEVAHSTVAVRPTSDMAPCAPLRSLVDAAGVDKSSPPAAITIPGADAVISDEDLPLDPFEPLIQRKRPHRTRPFIPRFRNYCRDSQGHPSTARNVIRPNPGDNTRRSAPFPRGEFEPHITLCGHRVCDRSGRN